MLQSTLKSPDECREQAITCERLAANASHDETRKMMLHLATRWRQLADEDAAKEKTT